jgi:cytochrome c-type biogenesis protein CcmH
MRSPAAKGHPPTAGATAQSANTQTANTQTAPTQRATEQSTATQTATIRTQRSPAPLLAVASLRRQLPALIVALALIATAVTLMVVSAFGAPAGGRAAQVQQIASGLRCPVCKDLSAADSPAPLAGQMRQQIAQQVAAGRSENQIRDGFIAAYGESVLMSPPHTGLGQTAYLLPALLMGSGLVVVVVLLRRWRREPERAEADGGASAGSTTSPSDREIVDQALLRLREEERR